MARELGLRGLGISRTSLSFVGHLDQEQYVKAFLAIEFNLNQTLNLKKKKILQLVGPNYNIKMCLPALFLPLRRVRPIQAGVSKPPE